MKINCIDELLYFIKIIKYKLYNSYWFLFPQKDYEIC